MLSQFKVQVRAYFQETKWFKQKYIPTMDEYMKVECDTSFFCFATTSFLGLGAIVTKDSMDWVFSDPKSVNGASVVGRLLNDIVGHKVHHIYTYIFASVLRLNLLIYACYNLSLVIVV